MDKAIVKSPGRVAISPSAASRGGRVAIGDDFRTLLVGMRNLSQILSMTGKNERVALAMFLPETDFVLPSTEIVQGILSLRGCLQRGESKISLHLKFCSALEARNMKRTLESLSKTLKNGFGDTIRVAVECMGARLASSTSNGSTTIIAEVVGVKPENVRASITFPSQDLSLQEAFAGARQ
jgi:hypothetical protein